MKQPAKKRPKTPEKKVIALILKGYSYTEIIAMCSVSSSRISLIKKKLLIKEEEEAKVMIQELEEEQKIWREKKGSKVKGN